MKCLQMMKILINSINTKWNLFLLTFETLKFKKISRARSYAFEKNIYIESSGYEIVKLYKANFSI